MKRKILGLTFLGLLLAGPLAGQWQGDLRLTNDPASSYAGHSSWWVATDPSGNIHIVWRDDRTTPMQIFYKRWNAITQSWEEDFQLTNASMRWRYLPAVATDGSGNVHVVWYDQRDTTGVDEHFQIYYRRWDAASGSWDPEVRLTDSNSESYIPTIATDGEGNVHIVWFEGYPSQIYYRRWSSATGSWNPIVEVTTDSSYSKLSPAVSADLDGNLHLVWYGPDSDSIQIWYKRWNRATGEWEADQQLTEGKGRRYYPSVTTDRDGNVWVVWKAYSIYTQTFLCCRRWNRLTGQWDPVDTLTEAGAGGCIRPSVATDTLGNVHLVWQDSRDGNYEVYYKKWDALANTWLSDKRLTDDPANSNRPSIASDLHLNLHVVWQDDRDGNREIYYKRFGEVGIREVVNSRLPEGFNLIGAYPNPFNSSTVIRYHLTADGRRPTAVTLRVYNPLGQKVRTLVDGPQEPGWHTLTWDGKDEQGMDLPSGVYLYRLKWRGFTLTRRMLILR